MDDDDITTASSPERRLANAIAYTFDIISTSWPFSSGNAMTSRPGPRGNVLRRDLGDGAIAGVVIGVVVAVALLAFCLYPFVVHHVKRRKRARRLLDTETGSHAQPAGAATADPNSHHRLSSTDSFKQDRDLPRGDFGAPQSKELGWTPHDGNTTQQNGSLGLSRQFSTPTDSYPWQDGTAHPHEAFSDDYQTERTPFPFYMPASMPDENPGVLKGTSADYYSPSIPSSAFGMETTPDVIEPIRTLSRGSSFRHNVKQIFRRQSGRGNSLASVLSSDEKPPSSQANEGTELGMIITTGNPTDSPTQLSPTTTSMPSSPPAAPTATASSAGESSTSPQPAIITPPQSPPSESRFVALPSPPSNPAPGTVNPMDIMPASTESEMWHRTEHQLLDNSYGSSPGLSSSRDQVKQEDVSTFTPSVSASSHSDATQSAPSAIPTNQEALERLRETGDHDVPMVNLHSHNHLSPSMIPESSRHPSYPSDQSTPCQGTHSTGSSTENTPSTQLDSPSPGSMNSSDFRHSASPQPGFQSSKTGLFRCDEPGCNQVFDQAHKLKHHQRYHLKDHKCPYKNCGKGFGTKTHLQRHINDRHEKKKKFHCAISGCDYSKSGGKAFPRKDNWKRHMTKIHNMDQKDLPEPVEIDSEMGGT
ncbi:hypothetical protein QQS21_002783 [Conoideocrella luteorostrata]|uniref:C2H2-type domain-containing protein n=1 Tax=Conoideocrella luteorostrata TaxID=1105319 RepID=A0AAJ0FW72_9HYPO|nr:hypothetical protein QQS21_002783 [Conoideocrella luteorostrata]